MLSGCGGSAFAVSPSLRAPWEHGHTRSPPRSTLRPVYKHTQPGVLKPEPRLVPLNSREEFGLTLAFWINVGKGGDFLFFSLTCLPVVSINKFGHVLRLPLQLLNAERNQPPSF